MFELTFFPAHHLFSDIRFHWLFGQCQRDGCWVVRQRRRQRPAVLHQDLHRCGEKSRDFPLFLLTCIWFDSYIQLNIYFHLMEYLLLPITNRKEICHNNYNQPYKLLNRNSNVFLLNFRSHVRIKISHVHISEIYKHHTGQQMQIVPEPSWISWWVHRTSDPHIKNLCVNAPIYTRTDAKMLFHHCFLCNIGLEFLFFTHTAFNSSFDVSAAAILSLWPGKIKHIHGVFCIKTLQQSCCHLNKLIVS